jgi:hypothetical protein
MNQRSELRFDEVEFAFEAGVIEIGKLRLSASSHPGLLLTYAPSNRFPARSSQAAVTPQWGQHE